MRFSETIKDAMKKRRPCMPTSMTKANTHIEEGLLPTPGRCGRIRILSSLELDMLDVAVLNGADEDRQKELVSLLNAERVSTAGEFHPDIAELYAIVQTAHARAEAIAA